MARTSRSYQNTVFFVAALATLVAGALVGLRLVYTHTVIFFFLIWNLLLAWIPWFFSRLADNAYRRANRINLLVVLCGLIWLVFFPNAPYIVTDFLHLEARPPVPLWFDIFLIFSFAWAGLFLGFSSLYTVQQIVREKLGRVVGWLFALGVLALSGFGIYLGRFLGWNSWDVVMDPQGLAEDVFSRIRHPFSHPQTLAVSFLATVVFTAIYLTLFALAEMPRQQEVREPDAGHRSAQQ